ncbi:co-chaperone GroES [Rickettsiales bacterium]|nr:co-chaperone GroES [Rickettsiales bacterium]
MSNIKPLHNNVLVERLEAETKTAGGIIIPDTAKEKPSEGKIIAVGNGSKDDNGKAIALDVKVGDKVLFAKWGGTEIKVGGKDLLIMKESDILAITQ